MFSGAMYALAPASRLPAGFQRVAAASSSTAPASAAHAVRQTLGPVPPRRAGGPAAGTEVPQRLCAPTPATTQHPPLCPWGAGSCLAGSSQLPACPAGFAAGGARRGGWAAFKKAQLGVEPRLSGERGRQQNTALSGGEPSFLLLLSLFIVMSWRSSWRARVRPTQAFSS